MRQILSKAIAVIKRDMDYKKDYFRLESTCNCSTDNKGHITSSVSDADHKKGQTDHCQSAWQYTSKNFGNILKNAMRTFMLTFIKMSIGNLELLHYMHCTSGNSRGKKMPSLVRYCLADSLAEINLVLKEVLLQNKWRFRKRQQVEIMFSSKQNCYCNQKILLSVTMP